MFTNCISEINNTKIGQAKDIDVIVPMYNLIESSDYSQKIWKLMIILERYSIDNNGDIIDIPDDPDTTSFNYKQTNKQTVQIRNNGRNDVQIVVHLKYLSNFLRTLEMPLINCEIIIFFNLE